MIVASTDARRSTFDRLSADTRTPFGKESPLALDMMSFPETWPPPSGKQMSRRVTLGGGVNSLVPKDSRRECLSYTAKEMILLAGCRKVIFAWLYGPPLLYQTLLADY